VPTFHGTVVQKFEPVYTRSSHRFVTLALLQTWGGQERTMGQV
jgi:hypothetical protein